VNLWDDYFRAPYRAVRAYVFAKLFLVMVALDTWMLMLGHSGRYGVDGFNVAHFGFLDRILPIPSASSYVCVLLLTGLLALSIALGADHWLARFGLFLLYTFSWSMSMLDSYQHHYFVSSILFCLVFFPQLRARDCLPLDPPAEKPKPRANKPAAKQTRLPGELVYCAVCAVALASYARFDVPSHPWLFFIACAGTVVMATWLYAKRRGQLEPRLVHGFGYNLLAASVAVLYTFTSIAKLDAAWRLGYTIRRISSAETVFAPLASAAAAIGISNTQFWSWLSTSVIPVEQLIAVGYLCAAVQDASRARWPRWVSLGAFCLALSLHVGAEAMHLEIGWFSYYMLALACAFLLPGSAIETLGLSITWPARQISELFEDQTPAADKRGAETAAMVAGAALVLIVTGKLIDLPGATAAVGCACAVLVSLWLVAVARRQSSASLRRAALCTASAAALMWCAIATSGVRWDFYRFLGGDLSRRGQSEAALAAYLRGEHYAPKGESRRDKIEQLRRQLGR
jgi:hypothetical protein